MRFVVLLPELERRPRQDRRNGRYRCPDDDEDVGPAYRALPQLERGCTRSAEHFDLRVAYARWKHDEASHKQENWRVSKTQSCGL